MTRMNVELLSKIKETRPKIHTITNYVTANDCANILLGIGASPIMADDIAEVEEITAICDALVINIGTLNHRMIEAMLLAGKIANQLTLPILLDPVGLSASKLRTQTALELIQKIQPTIIKGNLTEIKTLYALLCRKIPKCECDSANWCESNVFNLATEHQLSSSGIDAHKSDCITDKTQAYYVGILRELSAYLNGAVIVATGNIDIVSTDKWSYLVYNGHKSMNSVTGTGCMLSSLMGAFCAMTDQPIEAALMATVTMGVAGEIAYEKCQSAQLGTGSLRVHIHDAISQMTPETLKQRAKVQFFEHVFEHIL